MTRQRRVVPSSSRRWPGALLWVATLAGAAGGCTESASLQWAQTAPAIEPLPRVAPVVRLGARREKIDPGAAHDLDDAGGDLDPGVW